MSPRYAAVVVLTVLVSLSGCSSDPDQDYCEALRDEQAVLDDLAGDAAEPGTDILTPTLESLRRLREEAPAELGDEYTTVVYAYENLVEAVDAAGVPPEEFRPSRPPEGLDAATARRLQQSAVDLAAPRVTQATLGIEDHATQVCDVDLRE